MARRDNVEVEDPGWGEGSRFAAHLDRGWSLLDRGDLSSARTSALEAQSLRPQDPDTAILLGAIELADAKPDESLRWYEKAAELDDEYLEAYAAAAAICLYDLGDAKRALAFCARASALQSLAPLERLDVELLAAEAEFTDGQADAARLRLSEVAEVEVLEAAAALPVLAPDEEPPDPNGFPDAASAAAAAFCYYDADGEPVDWEDREQAFERVLATALRLSRIWIDLGQIQESRELLRLLVERFSVFADVWHLLSEAEYHAGDIAMAVQAALRTYKMDQSESAEAGLPSPALLHARVLDHIRAAPVPKLARLVEQSVAFSVVVTEQVPAELVLEGLDPRLAALALSVKLPPDPAAPDTAPFVSGIAIYRRALAKMTRGAQDVDGVLQRLVYEELALALGLDDAEREALSLPPADPPAPSRGRN